MDFKVITWAKIPLAIISPLPFKEDLNVFTVHFWVES